MKSIHTKPLPPVEYLRAVLRYEPESGNLIWLARKSKDGRPNTQYVGKIAGTIGADGYRYVMIVAENFLAHRIIWKMMTGEDPINEVDHKDLCRSHNKWTNLREATHGENNHNVAAKSHSTSGIKGVRYIAKTGNWVSAIRKDGRQHHLGTFNSSQAAADAYTAAAKRLYGEMARVV